MGLVNCQSQHFNSVIHTRFTRASIKHQTNHSKLLSVLNLRTNQLLLSNSANAAQVQPLNNSTMSAPNTSPQTPPALTAGRETLQSTPNSAVNSTRSSNEGPMAPNLENIKEEVFKNNSTQLFTKGFLAMLTSKVAVLKEVRDFILQGEQQRSKDVNPYLHSYYRDQQVPLGCVCVDKRVAIPNSIQDAVLESLHLTHRGSWGMITLMHSGPICFANYSTRPQSANHALRLVRILNQSLRRRNGNLW